MSFPRPLTHDLFKNVLETFNLRLIRAEVHDLVDGTFFARLILSQDAREVQVDARPSDAIALAMRCGAPILVEEKVMNSAGIAVKLAPRTPTKPKAPETPMQLMENQLRKAIEDERYEEAAELRDKLKRLKEHKVTN